MTRDQMQVKPQATQLLSVLLTMTPQHLLIELGRCRAVRDPRWPDWGEGGTKEKMKGRGDSPAAPVRSLDMVLSENWRSRPSVEHGMICVLKGKLCHWVEMVLGWGLEGAADQEESGGCWDPSGER